MKQTRGDAGKQFTLGQPVLHEAGMNVDRASHRYAVERELLIVNAIGRETGEQDPDKRNKADDEA